MSNRNRTAVRLGRPRSEIIVAVIVGAAIVAVTLLTIWLLRPGARGVPGGGGLVARQPRSSLLVGLTFLLGLAVVVRLLRHPIGRMSRRVGIAVGIGAVLVLAVVAGLFWPGGLLRDYGTPDLPTPGSSVPVPSSTPKPTVTPGSTAAPASAPPTTVVPGASGG